MKRNYHEGFRNELSTDIERARIERARVTGKSKNPAWHKFPHVPKMPELPTKPEYPNLFTSKKDTFFDRFAGHSAGYWKGVMPCTDDVREYVEQYALISHHV